MIVFHADPRFGKCQATYLKCLIKDSCRHHIQAKRKLPYGESLMIIHNPLIYHQLCIVFMLILYQACKYEGYRNFFDLKFWPN